MARRDGRADDHRDERGRAHRQARPADPAVPGQPVGVGGRSDERLARLRPRQAEARGRCPDRGRSGTVRLGAAQAAGPSCPQRSVRWVEVRWSFV